MKRTWFVFALAVSIVASFGCGAKAPEDNAPAPEGMKSSAEAGGASQVEMPPTAD